MKVIIHWITRDQAAVEAIRKHFRLPRYTTINGQTPGAIKKKDLPMFEETARRGFFRYTETEWSWNGVSYTW